jgi:TPR repeat protein
MATGTMGDGKIRAELLETARSLNAETPDQLSIAALCKKTGMSRTSVRSHFSTNAALKAAVEKNTAAKKLAVVAEIPPRKLKPKASKREALKLEAPKPEELKPETLKLEAPKVEQPNPQARPATPIAREDWLNRRFRVFERALALLETRAEETALEQSQSLLSLEEKLTGLTAVRPAVIELPPFVDALAPQEIKPEMEKSAETVFAFPPPLTSAIPDTEFRETQPMFDARKKMLGILENAGPPKSDAASAKPQEYKRAVAWALISAAVLFAVLISVGLFSFGGTAGAKQIPVAEIERHASVTPAVLVIDATGATPKPEGQQASIGTQNVIARAESGDAHAQTEAALAFLRGDGVDADPMAAIRWSETAAAKGDPNAQFILASLYAEGVKPNPERAFRWFSTAAARGNAKAMHNLAMAYLNGQGVEKDTAAAVNWLVKAANSGYRDSAFDLAVLYERGEGVARSPQDALKWYDTAVSLGDSQAAERAKFLRTQLSLVAADTNR